MNNILKRSLDNLIMAIILCAATYNIHAAQCPELNEFSKTKINNKETLVPPTDWKLTAANGTLYLDVYEQVNSFYSALYLSSWPSNLSMHPAGNPGIMCGYSSPDITTYLAISKVFSSAPTLSNNWEKSSDSVFSCLPADKKTSSCTWE